MSQLDEVKTQFENEAATGGFTKTTLEALAECDDIMPSSLCDDLDLPSGSTYKRGVQSVQKIDENLDNFNKAFAELGEGWQGWSDTRKRALVYIAKDRIRFGGKDFIVSGDFEVEVMPLFHRSDPKQIKNCLNEIIRSLKFGW